MQSAFTTSVPPPHPAVHQHLHPAVDGRHHLRQRGGGGERGVELAAAVVGDHDPGRAGGHERLGVVAAQHALDQHRQPRALPQPGDGGRLQTGIEAAGVLPDVGPAGGEALDRVAEDHAGREPQTVCAGPWGGCRAPAGRR
jgi:hypothetical protein